MAAHAGLPKGSAGLQNQYANRGMVTRKVGRHAPNAANPGPPVPERQGAGPAKQTAGGSNLAKGASLGVGMRLGRGVVHAGKGATTNSGGITALMAMTFGVVALAKIRGTANISTSHALFGGFILLFLLVSVHKFAPQVAVGFAVLVLITAILEYGQAAFSGLFGKGSGIPSPITQNSDGTYSYTGTSLAAPDPTASRPTSDVWTSGQAVQGGTYSGGTGVLTSGKNG